MQYLVSFFEGITTFISPCLLPMLPVYISYFAAGSNGKKHGVWANALLFVLGFTVVFTAMGAFAGTLGSLLRQYQTAVNIVSGAVVILFGLQFLGVLRLNIFRGGHTAKERKNGLVASFLFGVVFSVGWTPCVGPFLGAALMMAAQQGSVWQGVFMLFLYSLGLGIPFVASAVLIEKLKSTFAFIKKHYAVINLISGGLLVIVGILMMTGLFGRLLAFLSI